MRAGKILVDAAGTYLDCQRQKKSLCRSTNGAYEHVKKVTGRENIYFYLLIFIYKSY